MRDYEELLKLGNKAQMEKLKVREHHGKFSENVEILFSLLKDEVRELDGAIERESSRNIRLEAADVANYAHMIIRACDNGYIVSGEEKRNLEEYFNAQAEYIINEANEKVERQFNEID